MVKTNVEAPCIKKPDTRRAYLLYACVCNVYNVYGPTIVCLWQNVTRLVSPIANIPQNCSNMHTTPNSPWSNFYLAILSWAYIYGNIM